MDNTFERRLHAGAMAGWWTILIAALVITFQWLSILCIQKTRPEFILSMWGAGATWDQFDQLTLWAIACLKLCILTFTMLVTWLTLWARRLRKIDI